VPASPIQSEFQPADGPWESYASHEGLRSVLDPADTSGRKNAAIDLLQRTAIDRALGAGRFGSVLDFGCGTGRMVRHLAGRAQHVIGVDITGAMLHRAARETQAANAGWSRIDGARLPLRDASVDRIVSVYVLQYAIREPATYAAMLRELARVLVPGGRLLCIEQVAGGATGSGSVGDGATCADYLEPAREIFARARARPVRLARPGRFERNTLHRHALPGPLRQLAARISLWQVGGLDESALASQPYSDWLLRFDAIDAAGTSA